MINITTIITIIIAILAFVLVWIVIKSVLKAAMTALVVIILGLVIIGGTLYIDAQDFKQVASEDANINITVNNETIIQTGINLENQTLIQDEVNSNFTVIIPIEEIAKNQTLNLLEMQIEESEIIELYSARNLDEVSEILNLDENQELLLKDGFEDEQEFKQVISALLINETLKDKSSLELVRLAVNSQITTSPEFLIMRFIKYMPDIILDRVI